MEQSEAQRWFRFYLRKVDDRSPAGNVEEMISKAIDHDEIVDPWQELVRVAAFLWGCHEVIAVRRSALEVLDLEPGVTYHEAAWEVISEHILESQRLTGTAATAALYPAFQRYEQGYGRAGDRTAFRQWLRQRVLDGEDLALTDERSEGNAAIP